MPKLMDPPSTLPWLMDPQLFLLCQGGIVKVWKCKRTSSDAVLMKREDFDTVIDKVTDHRDLVEDMFKWDPLRYQNLIDYISPRRLLVNAQGLVIVELCKFDLDGNLEENELPIYMWSLDVLHLHNYVKIPERPIPFRTIKYLEDKNGTNRDVPVESSPNELKLEAELAKENTAKEALEKEVTDLKTKKKALEDKVTKLTAELDAQKKKVEALERELKRLKEERDRKIADLEGKNKALEAQIVKLTAELATRKKQVSNVEQELNQAKSDKQTLERKVKELQDEIDTLIRNKKKDDHPADPPPPPPARVVVEPWMNGHSGGNWVGSGQLWKSWKVTSQRLSVNRAGGVFSADNTTNVHSNYFSQPVGTNGAPYPLKLVVLQDLNPHSDKARFDPNVWGWFNNAGTLYVARSTR